MRFIAQDRRTSFSLSRLLLFLLLASTFSATLILTGLFRADAEQGKQTTPNLREIQPDVVTSSAKPITLALRGVALGGLSKVTVLACDGSRVNLPLGHRNANVFSIEMPPSMLSQPCVLRVSTDFHDDLPVGVADPQLAKLKVPAYDPDGSPGWGGMFNYVFGAAQPQLPNHDDATVGVNFTSPIPQPVFILGKDNTALFRLKVLPQKNNDESDQSTLSLWLPGVRVGDVHWGPNDTQNFWLGTLSPDGTQITFRQALADMVPEPAGTPDQF